MEMYRIPQMDLWRWYKSYHKEFAFAYSRDRKYYNIIFWEREPLGYWRKYFGAPLEAADEFLPGDHPDVKEFELTEEQFQMLIKDLFKWKWR